MPLLWFLFGPLDSPEEDAILEIGTTRQIDNSIDSASSLETSVEHEGEDGVEIYEKTLEV